MVIKSHTSELRDYEESRIAVLTHIVRERSHITLSFIFDSLMTLRSIIRT